MRRSNLLGKRLLSLCLALLCAGWAGFQICMIKGNGRLKVSQKDPRRIRSAGDNLSAIGNSTLGFEKILVISLPERHDKKDVWALASMASNLDINWVEGVRGENVVEKAWPAGWNHKIEITILGSFRAHMNAIRRVVEERLSTALIVEDDIEWDVMLRQQLLQFAHGARYLQGNDDTMSLNSPYGDDWDLLHFGHCGARSRTDTDAKYWAIHDDPTVIPTSLYHEVLPDEHLIPDMSATELKGNFTRLIYQSINTRCAYGYALSLKGAQRLLYYFSVEANAKMMDYTINDFCSSPNFGGKCIAVFPNLFDQYRPAGSMSKDSDRRDGNDESKKDYKSMRKHGISRNIVFPLKAGLGSYINGSSVYQSHYMQDSLWPRIDVEKDKLPMGMGFYLTKDKFKGYPPPPNRLPARERNKKLSTAENER